MPKLNPRTLGLGGLVSSAKEHSTFSSPFPNITRPQAPGFPKIAISTALKGLLTGSSDLNLPCAFESERERESVSRV